MPSPALKTAPALQAPIPTDAPADLLRHIRADRHCTVALEGDMLVIRPVHRCSPPVVEAVIALQADVRAILQAEAEALAAPDPPADPAEPPEPTDAEVEALAEALAAKPGHRVTDRNAAMPYFRAQARNRLRRPNRRPA